MNHTLKIILIHAHSLDGYLRLAETSPYQIRQPKNINEIIVLKQR